MKGAFFSKLCTEAKSSARALNYKNIYFGRRSSAQFPAATKPPLYPGTGEGSFRFFFAYRAAAPGISGYRPAENYRARRKLHNRVLKCYNHEGQGCNYREDLIPPELAGHYFRVASLTSEERK